MTRHALIAVETGGTKIICRIVDDAGRVLADRQWPTTTPDAAIEAIVACAREAVPRDTPIAGIGIAAFGPLIVDPASPQLGLMLQTPKPGWSGSNLRAALAMRLDAPAAVETDVNAAAVAEQQSGAGAGLPSVGYLTVGTGIGAGLAVAGRTLAGALHPEVGHIRLVREAGDTAPSNCPFHDDCAEGLVSGPAIARRIGAGRQLSDEPEAMALVARYLGQLTATLVLAWSPHRLVLGGGVMKTPGLIAAIDAALRRAMGSYGAGTGLDRADFLMPAALLDAGLEGALMMARRLAAGGTNSA